MSQNFTTPTTFAIIMSSSFLVRVFAFPHFGPFVPKFIRVNSHFGKFGKDFKIVMSTFKSILGLSDRKRNRE